MKTLDMLVKSLILLAKENKLREKYKLDTIRDSKELIQSIINSIKHTRKKTLSGSNQDNLEGLIELVVNYTSSPETMDNKLLCQTLRILLKDEKEIYEDIKNILTDKEETDKDIKKLIGKLRDYLFKFHKEMELAKIISKANYDININNGNILSNSYISDLIKSLENINISIKNKDTAILKEIDISDPADVEDAMVEVKNRITNNNRIKTGWESMNKMLCGGFRRGEQWVITSLQHNYKSGLLLSFLIHFATLNTPDKVEGKKPLILLISLEDDLGMILEFIYTYLYFNENKELPNLNNKTKKELQIYITNKLQANGYFIKILRVDPAKWDYQKMISKTTEYELIGYDLQILLIDYLAKLPTVGCTVGPMGYDVKDLFDRVRQYYCSNKNCLVITPHQLSTDALALTRSGVLGFNFISEVCNKNYYADSKQIPQVIDGEICIKKDKNNKKWGLYIGKGKHKGSIAIPDEDKQLYLEFPMYGAPIPMDGVIMNTDTQDVLNEVKENIDEFKFEI